MGKTLQVWKFYGKLVVISKQHIHLKLTLNYHNIYLKHRLYFPT